MNLLKHWRRRVKVEITCPHGEFIPAAYTLGRTQRYGCESCQLRVRLTTFRGELDW